ncbi:N-acetylglucosamine-6-phosphate deacetylase [Legionella massiliensis]|uniref:N-acetylglucosamine-6-phosphate deacetylase n=1 Tax=Legionella massiliensis TaxID=1034943 RepID=A0A078KT97_9GAMM|nr:N-acetylglucosamine-6-phosphate deacetylase [Legionella massiliensis]CDZ76291.1 N-acetylglucosamine-6-phosphate deacetylase [Legionella massiliensis]CEE12029.1 N-acetylglucosamine-6-phosphate deacetylase [Legionella massiliensis]
MLIKNIYVYEGENSEPQLRNVAIIASQSWKILRTEAEWAEAELADPEQLDANGCYTLMPGMLDAHVHGQGGIDFSAINSPDDLAAICLALGATGLSYAMATFVSLPIPLLKEKLSLLNEYLKREGLTGATLLTGVHLEGPFISKDCKGAHDPNVLQDSISIDVFRDIISAAPEIKEWKVTLAPELPGAIDFIKASKKLEEEGISVKVFLGHCNPDNLELITEAIAAGAVGFTHLGNACRETGSRKTDICTTKAVDSVLVRWVLQNPGRCPPGVELIVDGAHLSQSFVSLIFSAVPEKIVVVTDDLGAAGLPDGLYMLASLPVCKEQNSFYRVDEEGHFEMKAGAHGPERVLAGSAAPLSYCAEKFAEWIGPYAEKQNELMRFIYSGIVKNPRISSLSARAIANLPDEQNFVIFNKQGQLALSMCQGSLISHDGLKKAVKEVLPVVQSGFFAGSLAGQSSRSPGLNFTGPSF